MKKKTNQIRLAAMYIEDHDFLFEEGKPQTINFGGRYNYRFEKTDLGINILQEENSSFLDDFFDSTSALSKVTNVSAIVGQNGTGKSSLLDLIRIGLNNDSLGRNLANALLVAEDGNNPEVLIFSHGLGRVSQKGVFLKNNGFEKIGTIYYSPHFDFKYQSQGYLKNGHDISFDMIVERDLSHLSKMDTKTNGFSYEPSHELLFRNSMRQIEFLDSDLVKQKGVFKTLFQLPEHKDHILVFRGYRDTDIGKYWNTPRGFQNIISRIRTKIESERNDWHNIRKIENDSVVNQAEINRYILNRNILDCIVNLLIEQMERYNYYLEEGYFDDSNLDEQISKSDAKSMLLIFFRNAYLGNGSPTVRVFGSDSIQSLLSKLCEVIDSTDKEQIIDNELLITSKDNVLEILRLHRLFLAEVNVYYDLLGSGRNTDRSVIGFINFSPSTHRFSSGENAILNLFSRLYECISKIRPDKHTSPKYGTNKEGLGEERRSPKHYLLLLDEADLGFHPSWKRKYLKIILGTIPYFFNLLYNSPSVQIIFTTHDPLSLSDMPNNNVTYIKRASIGEHSMVLDSNDPDRPSKTFGANISELLADSFFLEGSLIGDFASDKIKETIQWLNDKKKKAGSEHHKKVIQMIDEPIVKSKLAEMYDLKMKETLEVEIIDNEIKKLEERKNKLRKS